MAAGFYFNILWRFDIRTKFLYGMAEEAKIESVTEIVGGESISETSSLRSRQSLRRKAILAARMYLENFIQNKKLFFIRNDKTSNKTNYPLSSR